jgi:hypothetical protein
MTNGGSVGREVTMSDKLIDEARELNEREQQHRADYEWVLHCSDVQQAFAGQVVAVHDRKVWAHGRDHARALEDAFRASNCPAREELALVFVEGQTVTSG